MTGSAAKLRSGTIELTRNKHKTDLAKPFIKVLLYEVIVLQVRIESAHAIDFSALPGGEFFVRIKTPASFQKPLAAQNFMDAGNTAAELMRGIEQGSISIGDLMREGQQFAWNGVPMLSAKSQMCHGGVGPHRPMAQQAAGKTNWTGAKIKLDQKVEQDVVIIAGIQSNLVGAARVGDGAHDINRVIAVEWCNLHRNHILDLGKLPPEFVGKESASDCGLQIETNHRNYGCDQTCMT